MNPSPVMPPNCEAPFIREEVKALQKTAYDDARFKRKCATEAKHRNHASSLEGIAERYERIGEALDVLAEMMPAEAPRELVNERELILAALEVEE